MRAAAIVALLYALPAQAAIAPYVLAIGNNAPPADPSGDKLEPLRYADDDAAAFYTLGRELGARAVLLTVLDSDSQRRFPDLAERARPPTLAELRQTVAWLKARFEEDLRRGDEPSLLFFFSGHGRQPPGEPASLVLGDGALTTAVLYDEILAVLPAHRVHIIVDACHAEAVVRPRDADARPVRLSSEEVQRYLGQTTLQRFPHVGALVATTSSAQAHEWDVYQAGVFSHEVLSGLRGAADVNGDGRVEYSELEAFLASANRDVDDPRARVDVVAHPPAIDARAPIVQLSGASHAPRLSGRVAAVGPIYIEDAHGTRVIDVRGEPGFRVSLLVPHGTLYVHSGDREARLVARPDERVELEALRFGPPSLVARGALEAALSRGLFASAFGPSYYRGFVDQNRELVAVPTVTEEQTPAELLSVRPSKKPAWAAAGVAIGLGAATAVLGGLALQARADFERTSYQREAGEDSRRFSAYQASAYSTLAAGAIATGLATWLFLRAAGKVSSTRSARTP